MLLHQFGDDLVLAAELLLQRGDGPPVLGLGRVALTLEGGGAVLEKLPLPDVEAVGCNWYWSQRSEMGTMSIRWRRGMATFSAGV